MKNKKSILITILEYVADYLPIILTILLVGLAALDASRRSPTTEEMLKWIVSILLLLATTELIARFRVTRSAIERVDGLEHTIQDLQKMLSQKARSDTFLRTRSNFPRMENLIDDARNEIWVAGVNLATMASLAGKFQSKMELGCNIRFLALAPKGQALGIAAKYYGNPPNLIAKRIKANLMTLSTTLKSTNKSSVEIRVLDNVIPTGFFITDPASPKGQMIVQSYLYQNDSDDAPLFELSKAQDSLWFSKYMSQFMKYWENAKPLKKQRASKKMDDTPLPTRS